MDKLANFLNFMQYSRIKYSSIFPTNESVLQHLLYVNGNGYECINGDMVDLNNHSIFKCRFNSKNKLLSKPKPFLEELSINCLIQNVRYETRENAKKYGFEMFPRPYPLCQYADIYDVDKTFPLFFINISNNLNHAWKVILEEEINNEHYDRKDTWESESATKENYKLIVELCNKFDNMLLEMNSAFLGIGG